MTPRTRLIAILLGGSALLIMIAVWLVMSGDRTDGTSWPPSDRAAFMRSCIEKCRASPGVTEARYPLCDSACACAADEGEKVMSASELASAAQAITSGNASAEQTAKMERLKAAGLTCAMRTAQDKK